MLAEANGSIGTGHLVEVLSIAEAARAVGLRPMVVVPAGVPASLLQRAAHRIERVESLRPEHLRACAHSIRAAGARVALTDFRCVTNEQLAALSSAGLTTCCVDEVGERPLTCAGIFNPTVLVHRHDYGQDSGPVFAGPSYFPLAQEYGRWQSRPRTFSGPVRSIVVTMGGVDRSGATLRIFDILDAWPAAVQRHIVIGGAFAWLDALDARLAAAQSHWRVHRNPPGIVELCADADVAITAGGNTLYELAALGTPAIVAHEDPHEAEQGRVFQRQGFGFRIGAGARCDERALLAALAQFDAADVRRAHSIAGRSIVDGRGASRICAILLQLTRDSTNPARSAAL